MAPTSHGRALAHDLDGLATGSLVQGPPPSTLAAQLVENISASTRSSRPDETAELKNLFDIIEKFKNQPELLTTAAERVEHNHMLIYVYARVVLESLRWDDPFADIAALNTEALRAINFVRVTIKETPSVLLVSSTEQFFIFRGQEPLWLWILPKILKMLGRGQCLALTPAIEGLLQDICLVICRTGPLWNLLPAYLRYIQDNVTAIIKYLTEPRSPLTGEDAVISLLLSPTSFLELSVDGQAQPLQQQCSYELTTVFNATRHASSLLTVLANHIGSQHASQDLVSSSEYIPWLVDSYFALYAIQSKSRAVSFHILPSILKSTMQLTAILQTSTSVDTSLKQKGCSLLVLLAVDAVGGFDQLLPAMPDANTAEELLCSVLLTLASLSSEYKPIANFIALQLIPSLEKLAAQGELVLPDTNLWVSTDSLHRPFIVLLTWLKRCFELLRHTVSGAPLSDDSNETKTYHFLRDDLYHHFKRLGLLPSITPLMEPPAKRRKVQTTSNALSQIFKTVYHILGKEYNEKYEDLPAVIKSNLAQLSDSDQCSVIDLLGYACCATDGAVTPDSPLGSNGASTLHCAICDSRNIWRQKTNCLDPVAKAAILEIFKVLVDMPDFNGLRRPRVIAMIGLRRLATHSQDPVLLDLESSSVGLWCMRSLSSSNRELRIAASRTLPIFLQSSTDDLFLATLANRNRAFALQALNSISDQNLSHLAETCIMAWSHVGRVVPEDQLNLVLVKLVDYLSHTNSIVAAAAFDEVSNLARSRNISPRELFEPCWKNIAFLSIKDLASRPKSARLLAELLELTQQDLLKMIQREALPWLVLKGKQEVIQRIAEARMEQASWQPCLDKDNLGPIVALLLVQDVSNVEANAMALLRHISPHFEGFSLAELILVEPVLICLELLKTAGEAEEGRKPHIRKALDLMVALYYSASGDSKLKRSNATGLFFMDQVLGMVSCLTDIFSFPTDTRSVVDEQKRSVKAMEELIRIGKKNIRMARPQISACILSCMPHDELRASAFSCWAAMILYLEEDDVEGLIETTFFLINHYWGVFDDTSQELSRELIEFMLKKHQALLQDMISKLPSLGHINALSNVEKKLNDLRKPVDNRTAFSLLAERIGHENSGVVLQALRELTSYLQRQQGYLQASAVSEQPDSVVPILARALLDCSSKYAAEGGEISRLCTQSLGLMGCLDSNRVETVRSERQIAVEHNFFKAEEVSDFVMVLLEDVMVKSFLSATDNNFQGLLSYAMQELLDRIDVSAAIQMHAHPVRGDPKQTDADRLYRNWMAMSEGAREVLTPFLSSRYRLQAMPQQHAEYPIFRPGRPYGVWMRNITLDLLRRPQNAFTQYVFEPLSRVIKLKDLSIAEFLFPFLVAHVIMGDESEPQVKKDILDELLNVLQHEPSKEALYSEKEDKKLYYEAVFRVLDYAMRWLQIKRSRQSLTPQDDEWMKRIQIILTSIPAELISQRAVDCKSYSRALFHLEQHIREVDQKKTSSEDRERLLLRLQDIYAQIDEPDGLEGISAHLHVLDINQQILSHRKAGRWTEAQTWYEVKLAEDPDNVDVQIELLTCLKESGQHDVLLNYVEGIEKHTAVTTISRIVPYAVEASWATGRWHTMRKFVTKYQGDPTENFNVSVAQALSHLAKGSTKAFIEELAVMRDRISSSMTFTATASLHACHEALLKCHVLTDLELIAGLNNDGSQHPQEVLKSLDRRLEVLGSHLNDKQYILSIRRAAMELSRSRFSNLDISSLWLTSARLARKSNSLHQSFNAVLHASQLGDNNATIENARILWKQGHNRKAIQTLQSAISSSAFSSKSFTMEGDSSERNAESQQNMTTARAQLLLAKWLDNAGQTHASALRQQYQNVPKNYGQWEKGHYYLGRHYKKVLESEKTLSPDIQSDEYLSGETVKLVIENYIRSLNYGTKYLYQTLPRILTLWLEFGAQLDKAPEGKVSLSRELHHRRKTQLNSLHTYLYKYLQRLPAYIFYTALPQVVARIAHPNDHVFALLEQIIIKVVEAHPRQALWSLFAIMTSKQTTSERRARGQQILQKLRGLGKQVEGGTGDLKSLLRKGEKLANQLLLACNNGDFQSNRTTHASITRDLNFNHNCCPCPLVVPVEACLTATLPTLTDNVKKHKPFSRDVITIDSFLDDVLVLGSLAKPRRLTARGSDGKLYMLLIKPKDDLRTDQRLMEFNSMINRSLKRDAESSRRQLYIKTYAVTPLNEECGIIEWIDGLKTLRDILLIIYRSRGIVPNYSSLAQMMKDAATNDKNTKIFTDTVLGMFPAVLPYWFISQFPNSSAWFAARLRYTRSCAVMSMVGTILGLGDRHGENVLLEEGNGGVFHVDFNCLFDKGLTFAQPERVPFRLTHNMVAAMGVHGYEGPFRKCSELTLSILRQQEETLMTILEAFIYDPTLDLQKDKKRKHEIVKMSPPAVVENIKRKVRGLLPNESIPLSVEGQVEELVKQAVNPRNLAAMYIGWCPFL
ncbi:putative Phosphatidylinositol 3 [Seiridium unicorne]|uniref:Serine/threonine-protein kinase MEC1 n=1 Tax=Seiridium unicorne TaxID=138068 RepID=A0ABR2V2M2_9PEZI